MRSENETKSHSENAEVGILATTIFFRSPGILIVVCQADELQKLIDALMDKEGIKS